MRVPASLRFSLFLLLALPVVPVLAQAAADAYGAVDPFIGTAGSGNTFPGATLPFGMMQWSPDTNTEAWYIYGEKQIHGFSLTHVSGAHLERVNGKPRLKFRALCRGLRS